MTASRLDSALHTLGLTEPERQTYLAVVSGDSMAVDAVVREVECSRSTVLTAARSLEERGLLVVDDRPDSPRIRARPPAAAAATLSGAVAEFERAAESVYRPSGSGGGAVEVLHSEGTIRRRLVRTVEAAREELLLVLPGTVASSIRAELGAAVDRGVVVYLLLVDPGVEDAVDALDVGDEVHVLRRWKTLPLVFALGDGTAGVLGSSESVDSGVGTQERAVAFEEPLVAGWLYGNALSTVWPGSVQCGLASPPSLPATFEHFRSGVTAAALHDLEGTELIVDLTGRDLETREPVSFESVPVREVKQSLVEPTNADFPVENALVLDTDDGLVTVAANSPGLDAFYEDVAADEVTLRAVE